MTTECRTLDLSMDEASRFSAVGELKKRMDSIPDWLSVGETVSLGHWKAECTSIDQKGAETDRVFVVGLRMKF